MTIHLLLLLYIHCTLVYCQYGILHPNTTVAHMLGGTIEIRWNAPFDVAKLGFVEQHGRKVSFITQDDIDGFFNWEVNVNYSRPLPSLLYLYLENQVDSSQYYCSPLLEARRPVGTEQTSSSLPIHTAISASSIQAAATIRSDKRVLIVQERDFLPISDGVAHSMSTSYISASPSGSISQTAKLSVASLRSPSLSLGTSISEQYLSGRSPILQNTNATSSNRLSPGAKIGLGLGISSAVTILVGLSILVRYRRWPFSAATLPTTSPTVVLRKRTTNIANNNIPVARAACHQGHPSAANEQVGDQSCAEPPGYAEGPGYGPLQSQKRSEISSGGIHVSQSPDTGKSEEANQYSLRYDTRGSAGYDDNFQWG